MQCATEGCTVEATKLVQFPWAEPVPACASHVDTAQQLMVNLGREPELRFLPLPQEPTPDLAASAGGPKITDDVRLGLELELERTKFERVKLELELLSQRATTDVQLLRQFCEIVRGNSPAAPDEPASVVEGPTPEPEADPQPSEDQQPSPA
jgi:hypothetical protein